MIIKSTILWQMSFGERYTLNKIIDDLPNKNCVIEIGSYYGGCTAFLAKKFKIVHSVDISYKHFVPGFKNIKKNEGLSYLLVPDLLKYKPSLIIVDGDHEYNGVKRDLECIAAHLEHDAVIVVHDSAYEPSKKALQEFIDLKLPNYTVYPEFLPGVAHGNANVGGFGIILHKCK